MPLHLLKDPINPVALQMLSAQTSLPVVVLLSLSDTPPALPQCTVYRVTENATPQSNDSISYDRLVSMLFEADYVITW